MKTSRFDLPGWIHGEHTFFGQPGKQHPDGGHVLFDRWRRGLALECLDVGRDEVLITSTLDPGQELLDRPIVSGSRISVPNRDREELEELFSG